jgi:hypothetical protein
MGSGINLNTSIVRPWFLRLALAATPALAFANPAYTPADLDILKQLPQPAVWQQRAPVDGRQFPQLWLGSVRWGQTDETIDYEIDSTLAPTVRYFYNFQIIPELHYTGKAPQGLNSGYYLMRMVVLRPRLDDEAATEFASPDMPAENYNLYRRFVTATEQLVKVVQGAIRAKVEIKFPAVSAVSMRNTLLIQFLPVDEKRLRLNADGLVDPASPIHVIPNPGFIANTIRIPFIPRNGSGYETPPPKVYSNEFSPEETLDLGIFMRQARLYLSQLRARVMAPVAPQTLAQKSGLVLRYWNSPELGALMETRRSNAIQVASALEKLDPRRPELDETLFEPLCSLLAKTAPINKSILGVTPAQQAATYREVLSSAIGMCQYDPFNAIEVTGSWHVAALNSEVTRHRQGAPSVLSLAFNFGTNRQQARDTFSSFSQGLGLMGFLPLDLKGILNLNVSYSVNESNSRSKFEGTVLSGNTSLDVHQWDMNLEFTKYRPCIMVRANPRHRAWRLFDKIQGNYICGEVRDSRPLRLNEFYFHIQPTPSSASAIDIYNPKNQVANMVVRGRRDFYFFLKSVRQYMNPVHDKEKTPGAEMRSFIDNYRTALPSASGVYTALISPAGPRSDAARRDLANPSMMDKIFHRYKEDLD